MLTNSKIRISSQYFDEGTLPIRVIREECTGRIDKHAHTFYTVALVDRGFGYHLYDNRSDFVFTGSVLGVAPGVPHAFTGASGLNCIYLVFAPELMDSLDKKIRNLPAIKNFVKTGGSVSASALSNKRMSTLISLLNRIELELEEKDAAWDVMAISALKAFLINIARYAMEEGSARIDDANMPLVGKAVQYIQDNFESDINSADISNHIGLSYDYLIKLFKNVVGQTPAEYIRSYRVSKAESLLKKTDMTVSEIAVKVGIPDVSVFSRQFKRVMGMSPSDVRKK